MPTPPPLRLARRLAPLLRDLDWGIGGSTLLHHLGLEPAPRDLDLVTREEDAPALLARLAGCLQVLPATPHRDYASRHFACFADTDGTVVEVMAGIAVRKDGTLQAWHFDPARLRIEADLPWMQAADWLDLYRLFDRPARVALLEAYLAGQGL